MLRIRNRDITGRAIKPLFEVLDQRTLRGLVMQNRKKGGREVDIKD